MRLNYNTVKMITCGAARIVENDGFEFYRFTSAEQEQYAKYHGDFLNKTRSTSGICMEFITDTCNLYMDIDFSEGTSRRFYAFDILCNNEKVAVISNFVDGDKLFEYEFALCNVKKNISLERGVKTIKIVFPWSVTPKINEICIDDNAFIDSVPKKDKILFYGDSITHGYDALYPTESYAYKISDMLGLECRNKAIGGECYFPELVECAKETDPKFIFAAYGTNDWNLLTADGFRDNCSKFYELLTERYPDATIFAITPIWRRDKDEERVIGDFEIIRDFIFELAKKHEKVIPIDGYDLVPHDEKYYSDRYLHPNSEGFKYYSENLYRRIKQYIG